MDPGSPGELTLALFELAEDLAVTSVHIVGHPPHVHCPAAAEHADVHDRGVGTDDIVPPVTVEVEVSEGASGEGPLAQPESPAADHSPQYGGGETGRLAGGTGRLLEDLRQVYLDRRQFPADAGPEGGLDPLGEFLEGQAAREKVLAEHDYRVLAFGIRNPVGRVVHG